MREIAEDSLSTMLLISTHRARTRLPGCIRLRNDLYCVGWAVKLCSLTHRARWVLGWVTVMAGLTSRISQ